MITTSDELDGKETMWPRFNPKFASLRSIAVGVPIYLGALAIIPRSTSDRLSYLIPAVALLIAAARDWRGRPKVVPDHYRLSGGGLDRGGF
jgi:hypothetical protein